MSLYGALLFKLIPLYMNIALGFLASKWLHVCRDMISRFMLFMINPLIIFTAVATLSLTPKILTLPLVVISMSLFLCFLFYRLSLRWWERGDSTRNILAFSAGSGNSGYFGLPLAILLFPDRGEGIFVMAALGITLFDNTVGYYMMSQGKQPPSECIRKLIRLPSLHAFVLGLFVNLFRLPLPTVFLDFMGHIKGTYTVLGMMIIGLGLASLREFKLDKRFMGMMLTAKFIAWPFLVFVFCFLDYNALHFYDGATYQALMLLSIVPLGVNSVIMASLFDTHPEKASAAVLLSTLIAFFYVPWIAGYFFI